MSKGMRALVAACCLCLLALAAPHVADWYHRHYGMGISDRINIRVALNGVLLPPSEYSLTYAPDGGYEPATATESGYSIGSDYGVYALSVDLNGREITLVVENVDNWWRTDILLDITRRDDGSMFVAATLDVINDEDQTPETREWIIERKFHEIMLSRAILLITGFMPREEYNDLLDALFLKDPDNPLLLDLEFASSDLNRTIAIIRDRCEDQPNDTDAFGRLLMKGLEKAYFGRMDVDPFAEKALKYGAIFPPKSARLTPSI